MTWIITRMPGTGEVTNITHMEHPTEDVQERWKDEDHTVVVSDAEFEALPKCPTCGNWVELRRCADCR